MYADVTVANPWRGCSMIFEGTRGCPMPRRPLIVRAALLTTKNKPCRAALSLEDEANEGKREDAARWMEFIRILLLLAPLKPKHKS